MEKMYTDRHERGIGGWLILVAIGIIIAPFQVLIQLVPVYIEIFSTGIWEVLTTPGSDVYNPLWIPILIGEMTVNAGIVLGWIFLAILFFTKKKLFPKFYIGMLVFNLAFLLLDAFAVKAVLPNEPIFDPDTLNNVLRTFLTIIIWVPYMLISKRVKVTFIQ